MTKQSLALKDIKLWLTKINLKLSNKECKDYFSVVDKYQQQLIGHVEFSTLCVVTRGVCSGRNTRP